MLNFLIIPLFFSAPSKGEYTLEVTYRSEIFDGEKWSAHTESVTQQKAITVRETADVPREMTNQKEKIQEMNHQMNHQKTKWKTFSSG